MALFKQPVYPKSVSTASAPAPQDEKKRSGLDFSKLLDPEWQALVRAEREAEEAQREARETLLRRAIDVCLDGYEDELSEQERSLVRSVRHKLNTFGIPSQPQERWLLDIAERLQPGFRNPADAGRAGLKSPGF